MEEKELDYVDKEDWIVKRILELGSYKNDCYSVKADIFGFDITNISVSIFDYFENNNNIDI